MQSLITPRIGMKLLFQHYFTETVSKTQNSDQHLVFNTLFDYLKPTRTCWMSTIGDLNNFAGSTFDLVLQLSLSFVHFDWGYHICIYCCFFLWYKRVCVHVCVSRYQEYVSMLLFLVTVFLVHNLAVDSSLSSNFLSHQFEMLSKI